MSKKYYDTDSVKNNAKKQKLNSEYGITTAVELLMEFISNSERIVLILENIKDWSKQLNTKPVISKIVNDSNNYVVGYNIMIDEYGQSIMEKIFAEADKTLEPDDEFEPHYKLKKVGEI